MKLYCYYQRRQDVPEEGFAPGSPRRGAFARPGRERGGASPGGRRGSVQGRGRDQNAPPMSRRDLGDFGGLMSQK